MQAVLGFSQKKGRKIIYCQCCTLLMTFLGCNRKIGSFSFFHLLECLQSIPSFLKFVRFTKQISLYLKAIRFVSARSSVYENRVLFTKPFQASQSWHQRSVYKKKVLVQTRFTKRMDFCTCNQSLQANFITIKKNDRSRKCLKMTTVKLFLGQFEICLRSKIQSAG